MHKKSCHHRGGQNKTKSGKKFKKSLFRIDYLNIRGLKGKIQEDVVTMTIVFRHMVGFTTIPA
jgi:hypothetical protein